MHVLYFDNKNDTVNPESYTVNDTVKAYNGSVFSLNKQNPEIKADDLSKQLNLSLSTVKRKIKVLKEQLKETEVIKPAFGKLLNEIEFCFII
jgi:Fic family protein